MSTLKQRIQQDVIQAMKQGEKEKLTTLRMLAAAIKQIEIDERIELEDARVIAVIQKMIKQRQEAFKQYQDANRPELAEKEQKEIVIIEPYLPQMLSEAELDTLIQEAIEASDASSMKDMGKVIGFVKSKAKGCADMAMVSKIVKQKLS